MINQNNIAYSIKKIICDANIDDNSKKNLVSESVALINSGFLYHDMLCWLAGIDFVQPTSNGDHVVVKGSVIFGIQQ